MKRLKNDSSAKKSRKNWFFFSVKIFPLVTFALACHQMGFGDSFGGVELAEQFTMWMENFSFATISNWLYDMLTVAGLGGSQSICHYASYLIGVLFLQIGYDVIVFLPEFCRSAFGRWTNI